MIGPLGSSENAKQLHFEYEFSFSFPNMYLHNMSYNSPVSYSARHQLGKGAKFALHHGKMLTTKRCAIQILHISTFQVTFKCGYNNFIPKDTDINSLHVTQIDLLHNDTFCST